MKKSALSILVWILIFVTVISACTPAATEVATKAADTSKATDAPKPTVAATAEPTKTQAPLATVTSATPKGLATTLDGVKSATIQIQAEGTFIDPEVGVVVNGAGRGSGFIIDPSGIAVTNNHVVTGAALIKVWVGGNKDKVYNARVLGVSECSDLAVIKIDGSAFPYLQWRDGDPKVGLEVYAAGYPLGDPEYTLTKGIVSKANANGKTAWASVGSVLEHDARINPGNSGGPLVDKDGQVVGVNFASNQANQYFAISRAEADSVLTDLKSGKDVNSIGVNGQVVTSKDLNLSGVWVSSVKSGSPADKSGLKAGDIIVQLEGLVIGTDGTKADYCQILRSHQPTDTLTMNVLRWGSKEILEGQLNGRQLKVTGTLSGGSQGGQGNDLVAITDDSGVITMAAPSSWQYSGAAWQNTWTVNGKSYPFVAQTLTVSPDVKGYGNFAARGVYVATSRDWASIGGYANLLEGVRSFYNTCTPASSKSYDDGTYEGQFILYSRCLNKFNALVIAARPKSNPQAYLVLIEVKYATDADLNEMDPIISSIDVNP